MQKRCDPLNDGFAEGNGELFFKHEPNLSAPGSHTIYAKIPPNLHEHPCECPRWTMPISRLLTEVTGLDSSEADGLLQKICVVCISYLKHAYTFQRQAIDNVAALLAARYLVTRRAVPFQKNLDKQQLMQTCCLMGMGGRRRIFFMAELLRMITVEPMLRILNRAGEQNGAASRRIERANRSFFSILFLRTRQNQKKAE
ncbi:uncharacterized protein LOC119768083 [Culex quinquefasciatus]|uniref:uncharacterized protein LOC119768083 n=1 Tax=Culex quinquefasciatus TaxID=7176 RepID=UPI0018E2D4EC|nr:uncharacterized protein LOC119768083 [Culex quinquefasciatus]